jgi:translation initiation factor 2B subunit (eIF-2B alpha/beta/delta family)
VNKVGTFALGIVAKELGVHFYVAAESHRMFPLNNADLPEVGGEEGGFHGIQFEDTCILHPIDSGRRKEMTARHWS